MKTNQTPEGATVVGYTATCDGGFVHATNPQGEWFVRRAIREGATLDDYIVRLVNEYDEYWDVRVDLAGWTHGDGTGLCALDYFGCDGDYDGDYLGADCNGVEPIFEITEVLEGGHD